jgi:hypothetical protein
MSNSYSSNKTCGAFDAKKMTASTKTNTAPKQSYSALGIQLLHINGVCLKCLVSRYGCRIVSPGDGCSPSDDDLLGVHLLVRGVHVMVVVDVDGDLHQRPSSASNPMRTNE